jgi:hypothetical protein
MQGSTVDIKSNIGGLQEKKKEPKHGMHWLSNCIWQCPTQLIQKSIELIGVKNEIIKFSKLSTEKLNTKL